MEPCAGAPQPEPWAMIALNPTHPGWCTPAEQRSNPQTSRHAMIKARADGYLDDAGPIGDPDAETLRRTDPGRRPRRTGESDCPRAPGDEGFAGRRGSAGTARSLMEPPRTGPPHSCEVRHPGEGRLSPCATHPNRPSSRPTAAMDSASCPRRERGTCDTAPGSAGE